MEAITYFEAMRAIKPGQKFTIPFGGGNDVEVVWKKEDSHPFVKNPSKRPVYLGHLTMGIEDIEEAKPQLQLLAALKEATAELGVAMQCGNCPYNGDGPKCYSTSCTEAAAEAIYDRVKEVRGKC